VEDHAYLGQEHVFDTVEGSVQGEASDQVDEEDHVGKCGRKVNHLQKYGVRGKGQVRLAYNITYMTR